MASVIEICNRSMSHIGLYSRLSSITAPSTKEERECALNYPAARDFVLESFNWSFAKKRKVLSLDDTVYSGWDYAYQIPADCIVPREIFDPTADNSLLGGTTNKKSIKYETVTNSDLNRTLILTNQPNAELIYTARVTDPNRFSATFIEALAYKLASDLAMPLTRKESLQQSMFNLFRAYIGQAASIDANNRDNEEPKQYSDILGARN